MCVAEIKEPGIVNPAKKVKTLKDFGENTDLTKPRREWFVSIPSFLHPWVEANLNDKRDWPIAHMFFNTATWTWFGSVFLWYSYFNLNLGSSFHFLGLAYFIGLLSVMERFILGLHYHTHRPIWLREHQFLNALPIWALCPFFGIIPGLYKIHHCYMHHSANNTGDDLSSTESFKRDSVWSFFQYMFRFTILTHFEAFGCWTKNNWVPPSMVLKVAGTDLSYIAFVTYMMIHHPAPTFYLHLGPWLFAGVALPIGNFSQHIFVDPAKHDCNYRLTYNIMNSCVNMQTFNDGYHVIHHYNSRLHWSELPSHFMEKKNLQKHYEMGAFTFNGNISFFDVGIMVLSGNLRRLIEKYYCHIGPDNETPTVDEVVEECERRLQRFDNHVNSTFFWRTGASSKQKAA